MANSEQRPPDRSPRRPRWAAPALHTWSTRAERLAHASRERESRSEMRWIWDEVCETAGLTVRATANGFALREPPEMGPINLGPPTRFSVALRRGQIIDDVVALSGRLAAAFEVDDAVVRPLVAGWVTVELVEDLPPGVDGRADRPDPDDPAPRDDGSRADPGGSRSRRPGDHGRRRHRGPAGGPRSLGG